MKALKLAAALMLAAGAACADPVEGMWKTQPDDGAYAYVRMAPCGDGDICGVIEHTFNDGGEYRSPNIGKTLVINMQPQGDGSYKGRVWRPSNDKIYQGKMKLKGNRLDLSGCVAGGLFCKTQTWARLK